MISQTDAILQHLQAGHTLTPYECLQRGWGLRCAARINDLRKRGYNIVTEGKDQWAVYRLVEGISKAVPASSFKKQGELLGISTISDYNNFAV